MTETIAAPITGKECLVSHHAALYALVGFYNAFNTRDLSSMSRNWAHSDEAIMANPLGDVRRGWPAIREVYEKIFNGPAKVYVEFYDYSLHETDEMFYAVGRERGDRRIELAIRTSRVFRRLDNRWQQVHHHGSIDNPHLLECYQKAVRNENF